MKLFATLRSAMAVSMTVVVAVPTGTYARNKVPVRTNLDCESEEIRQYLQSWIQRRKALSIMAPKTPIQISFENSPQASSAVKQDRLVRKARFEEIQKHQREHQEEKESLPVGEVRWERPPYAKAYPGRAEKAGNPSASAQNVLGKRSAAPDSPSSVQQEGKPLADIEEGESRRKRAKVSDSVVAHREDMVCQEQHEESNTVENPTSPNRSTTLDTAEASAET
ncbi:hypothetical protein CHU98_g4201 [Xylaria longipes]|nr:hypothetical protein CHU98_g4201 [Xylaria longipes]